MDARGCRMRRRVGIQSLIGVLLAGHGLAAGGDTKEIRIAGGGLPKPIAINDPAVAGRFRVGTGPGTFELRSDGAHITKPGPSFIVDWDRGLTSAPKGVPQYQVSFVTGRRDKGVYVVFYSIDPSTQHGYVYIPGVQDPQYASNTWLIARGVEGNWFHAWSAWEQVVNPLISQALGSH